MSLWDDFVDTVSSAYDAAADAVQNGVDDLQDLGEDLEGDLEDSWNEGTEAARDAFNDGDVLGVIVGVLGAGLSVPVAVGGNLADATSQLGGIVTGSTVQIGTAVLGGLIGVGIIAGTLGFGSGTARDFSRKAADWSRLAGHLLKVIADAVGYSAARLCDITASFINGAIRDIQCGTRSLLGADIDAYNNAGQKRSQPTLATTAGHSHGHAEPASGTHDQGKPDSKRSPSSLDATPSSGLSFGEIRHFFVLMFENRSFDHLLGRLPDVDGADRHRYYNLNHDNTKVYADFALRAPDSLKLDIPHEFDDVHKQMQPGRDGGPLGNFISVYEDAIRTELLGAALLSQLGGLVEVRPPTLDDAATVMASFATQEVPVMTKLATEFAVCQRWHSSLPGPTLPNRQFVHAATAGGMADSPPDPMMPLLVSYGGFRYENGTIYDRLAAKCVPWKIYYGDLPPLAFTLRGVNTADAARGWSRIGDMDDFTEDLAEGDEDFARYVFIEPTYKTFDDFKGNSYHPLASVAKGEGLLKLVYETIRASQIWNSSALIVIFDEHGGFYDHVEPPYGATPPGDEPRYRDLGNSAVSRTFQWDRYGMRVPALVISPWIPKGTIDDTLYDHASVIATVSKRFNLGALTNRDANAATFDHLFSLRAQRATPLTVP